MPATPNSAWTFAQQGSATVGLAPKTLRLTGWSQPFGRPRQGPIVDAGIEIRRQITYFPGRGVEPLINAMGQSYPPWDLHGRWMDQAMGAQGLAQTTALAWKDFVADSQIVLASWNNIIAYRIFIRKLTLEVESPAEIVWKIHADVLSDLSQAPPVTISPVRTPLDLSSQMGPLINQASMQDPLGNILNAVNTALALLPAASDAFLLATSALLTPFLVVEAITQSVSDFASATSTDLQRMAGSLSAMQTAVQNVRSVNDSIVGGAVALQAQYSTSTLLGGQPIFSSPDVISLQSAKIQADIATTTLLALIADMNLLIQSFTRGDVTSIYTAGQSDTWESIALVQLGSVDGAQAIKSLNGIQYGAQPVAGRRYQMPTST